MTRINERWAMGFVSEALSDGRHPRVPTVVDMFASECVALVGATHVLGEDVVRVLTRAIAERGRPAAIQCDDGTEFLSRVANQWAWTMGVQLLFSRPGKADRQRDQRGLQRQPSA